MSLESGRGGLHVGRGGLSYLLEPLRELATHVPGGRLMAADYRNLVVAWRGRDALMWLSSS